MQLTVSGYGADTTRYRFLWGFYVRGFKPWEHCQRCFVGTRAEEIKPTMQDAVIRLDRPADYFYLHGNAKTDRRENNLHLAVWPKAGATATVVSKYGPVFTIEDAEEIEIQDPILELSHLDGYYKCPNFRFGLQMYPTPLASCGPQS